MTELQVPQAPAGDSGSLAAKPVLLFFFSPTSGACRKAEGFLAQVLQRRHNHETFELKRLDTTLYAHLLADLKLDGVPAFCVIEAGKVSGRLVNPSGVKVLREFLGPWLR